MSSTLSMPIEMDVAELESFFVVSLLQRSRSRTVISSASLAVRSNR